MLNAAEEARKVQNWVMGQQIRQAREAAQPLDDTLEDEEKAFQAYKPVRKPQTPRPVVPGYAAYRAGERAGYAAGQATQSRPWWQRAGEWVSSPSTWWGMSTDDVSVLLMKKARGFPDISIPLPVLKGFGMDDVAGPLKYTLKTDTLVRATGRGIGDFSAAPLMGIGLGITVTPNVIKNIRNKNPWHQTTADLIIDTLGFGVSELAGWGAGIIAGGVTVALGMPLVAPYVTIATKVAVDGAVSIGWDYLAERYGWNGWLSQQLEERAQSFGQNMADSMRQALDTEKYPPAPTPPPVSQMTGTPTPPGHNLPAAPSGTPTPGSNAPVTPHPTPPPTP